MEPERWQEIERLFNSAMELEPGDREAFLARACPGDEELRKTLERLLARQQDAERFMERPALEMAARNLAADPGSVLGPDLSGSSLSHYRILGRIGAGGMGVVYRAKDSTLGRDVAIKVLPEAFAADAERMVRFEREARLLASLNHPNIAAIHGLERVDERRFLVLEWVEGQTLSERLRKGPLPVEETIEVCRQIAEGMEAAHEKGIIHRDLKPANVRVTPDGKVKVLDFGLARALRDQAAAADLPHSLTSTDETTRPGVVLGTAAYMSPEQAKGKPVDKRADIWSFGCVLYECLTGKRAFEGETVTETLAAILNGEPDWQALPAEASENLRAVLRRCLQKDPGLRLRDIGDARIEIGETAVHPSKAVSAPWRLSLRWLSAVAALTLLAGIAIGFGLMRYFQPAPAEPVVSTIKIKPGYSLAGMSLAAELIRPSRTAVTMSTDGSFIVYSAIEENRDPGARVEFNPVLGTKPQLYLRKMNQAEANPIAGSEGGINPFLSPDNRWVGFWADWKLKKVPVQGGMATTLCDTPWVIGANWGRNDRIVFSTGVSSGISMVAAGGGTPESLTKPDLEREESSHRLPVWLPSGEAVLFTVMRHAFDPKPRLALLRVDTGEWKVLLEDAADGRYLPTGHLVFLRQGTLMAVGFDPSKSEVMGEPQPLIGNIVQTFATADAYNTAAGQFAVSDTGWLIYAAGGVPPDPMNALVWVDRHGREELVTEDRKPYRQPRLSPDGQKIAYASLEGDSRIWVYDLARGTHTFVTSEGHASTPVWTATGKQLVFSWMKSGGAKWFWQPYDGSSSMQPFIKPAREELESISPDGKTFAIVALDPGMEFDIVLFDTQSGQQTPFLNSRFAEAYPELSPDGRWIAYATTENKEYYEVYVTDFPGKKSRWQISNGGGYEPMWSRDGRKLFYRGQGHVWAVDVQTKGGFKPGKPVMLFDDAAYITCAPIRCDDLSLDSQRFLMVKREQRKPLPLTELILVQNWFNDH